MPSTSWQQLRELARQPLEPGFAILDGVNVVLQQDFAAPGGQNAPSSASGDRPGVQARAQVYPALVQQKALQMLACPSREDFLTQLLIK